MGFRRPPSRLGTGAPHCRGSPPSLLGGAPLGQAATSASQVRFRSPRGARGQPHAHLSRSPQGRVWAPAGTSTGTPGLPDFFFVFLLLLLRQKALAARRPLLPGPRHLPFTPTPHLPDTHAARCLSRQTMASGPARQPTPSPRPHPGTPRSLSAEGLEGGRRRGSGGHNGGGGHLPLGTGAHSRRGEKGKGRGSPAPPSRGPGCPAPNHSCALTSTMANRSSSSPGSGIGSFKGTLCALKSVCCESMLPALPMLAARRGRGLLRAPCVSVGNQNSSGQPAPARWRDLPGSPPSAAPRRVCGARRSLAAFRAEPPPSLPHAPRRLSAAPASFSREGSSGRRAPICMLHRGHAALCQWARGCSESVSSQGPGRGRR